MVFGAKMYLYKILQKDHINELDKKCSVNGLCMII